MGAAHGKHAALGDGERVSHLLHQAGNLLLVFLVHFVHMMEEPVHELQVYHTITNEGLYEALYTHDGGTGTGTASVPHNNK